MSVEQQPAYILHARAYRETSLLIEAFTRDNGRVGLVARGVRRERSRLPRGVLQPFQPLLLSWVARHELGTLTAAEMATAPLGLAGDSLLAAIYINELVLRLSGRNDAQPSAFANYALCLSRLAGEPAAWALRRFERDFLADLGYALALEQAADGRPIDADADYGYDPDAGAVAWRDGMRWPRVHGATLLALAHDEAPGREALLQLRRLVRAVVRHLVGGDLNAWSMAVRITN